MVAEELHVLAGYLLERDIDSYIPKTSLAIQK